MFKFMAYAAFKTAEPYYNYETLFAAPGMDKFPQLRFMGSKYRLISWVGEILSEYKFETALDAFSGSGAVSYLLKTLGKTVISNDFLNFCSTITTALIENNEYIVDNKILKELLTYTPQHKKFIEKTFTNIFFTTEDLRFLDLVSWNIKKITNPYQRSLALSSLIRSCIKRQPRGVFTVAGDPERYKDGRRDLKLSIKEHFVEQIEVYNQCVFTNGKKNKVYRSDVFELPDTYVDLVYMDPPYVPRADDNCYVKRYHFLEGLSCYWENMQILEDSKVKKLPKLFTPFSYRKTAVESFEKLFKKFNKSILALSYSSNGYPDLDILVSLMKKEKKTVQVYKKNHRYHFGTHAHAERNEVEEYLIVGA
jgi:adenine-specific DNA-methyltransferase